MKDFGDYQLQYQDQPYENHLIHYRKKKIAELLTRYNHRVLLEIGCGLDPIFTAIDSFEELYIVEPAELFYTKALEDVSRLEMVGRVRIFNKLFEESVLDLAGVSIDFILLSCLLHEVPDPALFLNIVYEVATQNTVVHINVPNAKSFHRLLAVEMGLISNEYQKSDRNLQFQQKSVFDIESLVKLTESAGFEVIERGSFSFKPFTHLQMENMIKAELITPQMLEGFYKMEKYLPGLGSEIFVNLRRR